LLNSLFFSQLYYITSLHKFFSFLRKYLVNN
jgi:hypothetical protein